jgi:hypothetical protein
MRLITGRIQLVKAKSRIFTQMVKTMLPNPTGQKISLSCGRIQHGDDIHIPHPTSESRMAGPHLI